MVRRKRRQLAVLILFVTSVVAAVAWSRRDVWRHSGLFSGRVPSDPTLVLTTGYCNCGTCCGWERTNEGTGDPVYNYGPMKGQPKKVGYTATGKKAAHGTLAADTRHFKFGTRLDVPGYGIGTVEDVGGAIKGRHLDLWFPTHDEARRWGRRWLKVTLVE